MSPLKLTEVDWHDVGFWEESAMGWEESAEAVEGTECLAFVAEHEHVGNSVCTLVWKHSDVRFDWDDAIPPDDPRVRIIFRFCYTGSGESLPDNVESDV